MEIVEKEEGLPAFDTHILNVIFILKFILPYLPVNIILSTLPSIRKGYSSESLPN